MITYTVSINNIPQGTIQAISRIEAVLLANAEYHCGGIHLSKIENWEVVK